MEMVELSMNHQIFVRHSILYFMSLANDIGMEEHISVDNTMHFIIENNQSVACKYNGN